ncbi:MAG: hypothetical protein LUG64_00730, partial [Clostridiales bacterium]|nr:hypothetical protein [Clostridiales bacterium]
PLTPSCCIYFFKPFPSPPSGKPTQDAKAQTQTNIRQKEAIIMKKILAAIEEFLELYFASFSITAVR